MLGLDPNIMVYKLAPKPSYNPTKQKLRRMKLNFSKKIKIKEEIKKQLDVTFLEVTNYPKCLANMVVMPKKDGRVRMYVDYRDFNKARPKDDFPFPYIDVWFANIAMFFTYSFIDGYAGYNQILMDYDDKLKTFFITPW